MSLPITIIYGSNQSPEGVQEAVARPNRAFWRYLFAGLALHDSSAYNHETTFQDDARDAVNRADTLLAELEKGGGD